MFPTIVTQIGQVYKTRRVEVENVKVVCKKNQIHNLYKEVLAIFGPPIGTRILLKDIVMNYKLLLHTTVFY